MAHYGDDFMPDKKLEPLPEMVERQCEKCKRFTVVAKDWKGPVFCIKHDLELVKELGADE